MVEEGVDKKRPVKKDNISEWKHSQVMDPEDVDGLSNLLSMEIDRDVKVLEKRLEVYWRKRNYYR